MTMRTLLAGAIAGGALLAPTASATQSLECTIVRPCYVCVMYPCYPTDWPPYLIDRAADTCRAALENCPV